jgi:predicted ribosome quality control (RQC) complex YloA/Tae2 family protein
MKKQVSGFDIYRLVLDLQELEGAYFDKAYQLSSKELVLRFNIPKVKKVELYINLDGSIYISSGRKPKPDQPGAFAMVLRKHLGNARVASIEQYEFDRIIVITLSKHQQFRLVLELFGEGNAVLIDDAESKDTIINTFYHRSWSARTLRPGRPYQFPPAKLNPENLEFEELSGIFSKTKRDTVRALAIELNLGGIYAEEVCKRAELDKSLKASKLTEEQIRSVHSIIQSLFGNIKSEPEPQVVYDDEGPVDAVPLQMDVYTEHRTEPADSLSAGLENYFENFKGAEIESFSKATSKLEDAKARLERQLAQQREAIEKFKETSVKNTRVAEALYQNYQLCEGVLNKINELRDKYDWDEILEEELLDMESASELNPHDGTVKVKLEGEGELVTKLDFRLDVNKNAERYYEAAKTAREKSEGAVGALKVTEETLKNLEKTLEKSIKRDEEEREESMGEKDRKKFWFERYRWFISSEGYLVVAGSDASTNDRVVKKYLRTGDRYAHADLHGAPSVVVRRKEGSEDDEAIPETTLNEACEFAVVHSKAWNSGLGSAPAYWVNAEQVSRTPEAGEYLAKGAFVIRGKRNYVTGIELKAALGEIEYEGVKVLMCGPVNSVSKQTNSYIVLRPGTTKKTNMAKKLRRVFKISLDEIMGILPPGDLDVLDTIGLSLEND